MSRTTTAFLAAALLAGVTSVEAQGRWDRRSKQEVARAQGVPPGHLPPANVCRVWYDNRPNGRQPEAISCRQAEVIASRDRNARVIYGEDAYDSRSAYRNDDRYRYPNDDVNRGIPRTGRDRDPQYAGGIYDRGGSRYTTAGFQNGYRDGLQKGREDARDSDRSFDPARHSWYRGADRGYENEYGTRVTYQARYRDGFEAGYTEAFRSYRRR